MTLTLTLTPAPILTLANQVTQLSDSTGRTAALAKLGSATTLASVVGTSIDLPHISAISP